MRSSCWRARVTCHWIGKKGQMLNRRNCYARSAGREVFVQVAISSLIRVFTGFVLVVRSTHTVNTHHACCTASPSKLARALGALGTLKHLACPTLGHPQCTVRGRYPRCDDGLTGLFGQTKHISSLFANPPSCSFNIIPIPDPHNLCDFCYD